MYFIFVCALQLFLLQKAECCTIRVNCCDNEAAVVRISVPITAEGIGEVKVIGDDINTEGVIDLDAVVPVLGNVAFEGPVQASGTLSIVSQCTPITPVAVETPLARLLRRLQTPESLYPVPYVTDVPYLQGEVAVAGEELITRGETCIDGAVPTLGDVNFSGYIPAAGKITILASTCL